MLRPRQSGDPDAYYSSSFEVMSVMRGKELGALGFSSLKKKDPRHRSENLKE